MAIYQIKEKEYAQKMLKEYERILAVAICYDSKKKVHQCKEDSLMVVNIVKLFYFVYSVLHK